MSASKRTSTALSLLIPTGVIGISSALAITQANAMKAIGNEASVADRLREIRQAVSDTVHHPVASSVTDANGVQLTLAEWLNFGGGLGWRNGGWGNGGWHNWGNGGWGNGGWHNWGNGGWGNGWHNGWHNFWHNW